MPHVFVDAALQAPVVAYLLPRKPLEGLQKFHAVGLVGTDSDLEADHGLVFFMVARTLFKICATYLHSYRESARGFTTMLYKSDHLRGARIQKTIYRGITNIGDEYWVFWGILDATISSPGFPFFCQTVIPSFFIRYRRVLAWRTRVLGRAGCAGYLAIDGLEDLDDMTALHLVEGQIGASSPVSSPDTFASTLFCNGSARCSTLSGEVRTALSITFCSSRTLPGQW